jgi:hypothetical protein
MTFVRSDPQILGASKREISRRAGKRRAGNADGSRERAKAMGEALDAHQKIMAAMIARPRRERRHVGAGGEVTAATLCVYWSSGPRLGGLNLVLRVKRLECRHNQSRPEQLERLWRCWRHGEIEPGAHVVPGHFSGCVYRKLRLGCSGDAVRRGAPVT